MDSFFQENEMEIPRSVAERKLREHKGDVVQALVELTNWARWQAPLYICLHEHLARIHTTPDRMELFSTCARRLHYIDKSISMTMLINDNFK